MLKARKASNLTTRSYEGGYLDVDDKKCTRIQGLVRRRRRDELKDFRSRSKNDLLIHNECLIIGPCERAAPIYRL